VAIGDLVAGLLAAQGVTLALLARHRTGRGQHVDVGMLDGVAALLSYQAGIYFATGEAAPRMGNRHPTIVPYETFEAADGEFVLAVGNDEQFRRFCGVAELETIATDERFATNPGRVRNYAALRMQLAAALRRKRRSEWIEALTAAGVPCGSVRDVGEVLTDPHLVARRMVEAVEHASAGTVKVLGVPIKLSDTPGRVRTAPPMLGQHTVDVLRHDLGLRDSEIEDLRSNAVI
jgi:crotonobetainyl-CoA:carnitine CoA-transferase CaiB-like acyl-CoA transferase